jgi:hypothetical protein
MMKNQWPGAYSKGGRERGREGVHARHKAHNTTKLIFLIKTPKYIYYIRPFLISFPKPK